MSVTTYIIGAAEYRKHKAQARRKKLQETITSMAAGALFVLFLWALVFVKFYIIN